MSHVSHSVPPVQFSDKTVRRSRSRHQVQQIGNYVIYKKTLGSGSMGTVKLAESLSPKDHQLVRWVISKRKGLLNDFNSMQSR